MESYVEHECADSSRTAVDDIVPNTRHVIEAKRNVPPIVSYPHQRTEVPILGIAIRTYDARSIDACVERNAALVSQGDEVAIFAFDDHLIAVNLLRLIVTLLTAVAKSQIIVINLLTSKLSISGTHAKTMVLLLVIVP